MMKADHGLITNSPISTDPNRSWLHTESLNSGRNSHEHASLRLF